MPENINVFERDLEEQPVKDPKVLHGSDLPASIVDQRHLNGNLKVIMFGTSDRPNGSTDIKAHFDLSTGVLSLWNGSSWLETTLT